jgi:hypothetical protein
MAGITFATYKQVMLSTYSQKIAVLGAFPHIHTYYGNDYALIYYLFLHGEG